MVKTMIKDTTIEIWDEDYINRKSWMLIKDEDRNAEILQIEHAYDDKFMVEVRRHNKKVLVEEDLD